MTKVVECVPNFSEGQNETIIQAIASSIRETDGCSLLDVDSGASTNRTVYTFFGSPSAVVQGALMAAKCARRLIDMSKHHGKEELNSKLRCVYSTRSYTQLLYFLRPSPPT